jgi:hypothetical protein
MATYSQACLATNASAPLESPFARVNYPFATNRPEPRDVVEAEHRQHAVVELAIRDLKDQALAHLPSGKYTANAARTVIAALAHTAGQTNPPPQIVGARRGPEIAARLGPGCCGCRRVIPVQEVNAFLLGARNRANLLSRVRAGRVGRQRQGPARWEATARRRHMMGPHPCAPRGFVSIHPSGEVAERLNAPVLKTGDGATRSGVRIPPSPLGSRRKRAQLQGT